MKGVRQETVYILWSSSVKIDVHVMFVELHKGVTSEYGVGRRNACNFFSFTLPNTCQALYPEHVLYLNIVRVP
jgi:hypothetical protein